MKKALRDHLYDYERIRDFLTTHLLWSEGLKGSAVPRDLDLYCDFCDRFQTKMSHCEHYQLFSTGWKDGVVQAQQIFEQMDLELIEEIGCAACFHFQASPSQLSRGHGGTRWR